MKKIIFAIVTIIFTVSIAQAKILNSQQFDMAFENYLNNPNKIALKEITQYLSEGDILTNKNAKAPIQGFYMGVLHKNPLDFKQIENMQLSNDTQKILNFAKSFSPDMEGILDNKIKYYPESPAFLDMLWGYYFATADNRVLRKMCYIQNNDPDYIIRSAAQWSYNSNMKTFPNKIKSCDNYK